MDSLKGYSIPQSAVIFRTKWAKYQKDQTLELANWGCHRYHAEDLMDELRDGIKGDEPDMSR
jgi:hypothetical protein